jgi:hypothetical protein
MTKTILLPASDGLHRSIVDNNAEAIVGATL